MRGEYAWLGTGWIGCSVGAAPAGGEHGPFLRPEGLEVDYGVPEEGGCVEERPGIFARRWSKARVEMDCNAHKSEITMLL